MEAPVDNSENILTETKPPCEVCGDEARVHISNEQADGSAQRHLCLECAAKEDDALPQDRLLNLAAVLLVTGVFILLLSLFADTLSIGHHEGFGWQQKLGVTLATILVLTSAVMRTPTVLVIGLMIGVVTILADYLRLGNSQGFGAEQIAGSTFGIILIAVGSWMSRRK